MLLEGAPPGGVSDQQRWAVQQMAQAGARIYYMRSDSKAGIHDRYTNQHAKMWLLDDRLALVGSENPSPESFPDDDKADGTAGPPRGIRWHECAGVWSTECGRSWPPTSTARSPTSGPTTRRTRTWALRPQTSCRS